MTKIDLGNGQSALINDIDSDLRLKRSWSLKSGRVGASLRRSTMHLDRLILGRVLGRMIDKSEKIEYVNGDKLDCRRDNLKLKE